MPFWNMMRVGAMVRPVRNISGSSRESGGVPASMSSGRGTIDRAKSPSMMAVRRNSSPFQCREPYTRPPIVLPPAMAAKRKPRFWGPPRTRSAVATNAVSICPKPTAMHSATRSSSARPGAVSAERAVLRPTAATEAPSSRTTMSAERHERAAFVEE